MDELDVLNLIRDKLEIHINTEEDKIVVSLFLDNQLIDSDWICTPK